MKRQDRPEDGEGKHHLVRDLRMHDPPGLSQRVLVDVLHTPRERGRRPVVLTVDHVADAADSEPDHRGGPARVDDLPERVVGPPRPHVDSDKSAEQAAPLADAALGQSEDAQPLAVGEDPPVLPNVQRPGADKAERDHPRQSVARVFEIGYVLTQQPEAEARRGDDPEHRKHAVPGDEERTQPDDVRVEVDDDREKHRTRRRDRSRDASAAAQPLSARDRSSSESGAPPFCR